MWTREYSLTTDLPPRPLWELLADVEGWVATTISYRIEVSGSAPDEVAQEVGTAVSADFPDVIAGLVAAAKTAPSR